MHCSCSFLANICIGYAMGYSSVAIEQLEKEFGTDVLDVHAKSWIGKDRFWWLMMIFPIICISEIGSLLDLGLTIGAPVGGGLSNWLSLRNCNLIMSPLVMLSWALIGGSNKAHLYFIFIGRIISGKLYIQRLPIFMLCDIDIGYRRRSRLLYTGQSNIFIPLHLEGE